MDCSRAITKTWRATMTKGDHMAAEQIPRTPRPAAKPVGLPACVPAAAGLLAETESPQ
jgi:hypothetical protein